MDQEQPARPRRARKRVDAPTTPDAIELAMDAEASGRPPEGAALSLIQRQTALIDADLHHRGWQIANERASMALRALTGLAGLAVAVVVMLMVISAARSQAVVVEPFGAPPGLADRGYNGQALAASLQDELQRIQHSTRSFANRRAIANAWTGDINVEVPSTGVSIGQIEKALRQKLGNDTHIGGDLTVGPDGALALTVRGDGIAAATFTGAADQLPDLIRRAAEHVYGEAEPGLYASYLYQSRRGDEGLVFIPQALAKGPDDTQRAMLLNTWGNLLWQDPNRLDEAITRFEAALAIEPFRWPTWNNLINITSECCGDEAALGVARRMDAILDSAPRDERRAFTSDQARQALTGDYTSLIASTLEEDRKLAGGVMFTTTGPRLAVYYVGVHDWRGVDEALAAGDPADPMLAPVRLMADAEEAFETGRFGDAVNSFNTMYRLFDGMEAADVTDTRCSLALFLAHDGRRTEALAALARAQDTTACRTLSGAIHEALGDRARADAAARRSIGAAPSSPFPYEARGRILLARGDLNGAAWRFDQAHARGPRWADPIKGQGDVLAARGRWAEAAARYREALRFAPRWLALQQALARAEARARR